MLFNAVNGNGPRRSQFCALQALMLRLSGEPFSFRYISFQKGMHKAPEFFGPISLGAGPRSTRRWPRPPAVGDDRRAFGGDVEPISGIRYRNAPISPGMVVLGCGCSLPSGIWLGSEDFCQSASIQ